MHQALDYLGAYPRCVLDIYTKRINYYIEAGSGREPFVRLRAFRVASVRDCDRPDRRRPARGPPRHRRRLPPV